MNDTKIIFAGSFLVLIYAVQFISAKYSLSGSITPVGLTILRFVIAGLFFVPFLCLKGRVEKLLNLGVIKIMTLAILAGFPYLMVINVGISLTSAGYVATVGPGSIVLFSFLLPWVLFREQQSRTAILSTTLICLGIALFIYNTLLVTELSLLGTSLFVLQGFMFSLFGVLIKRWNIDPVMATASVSLVSCLFASIFAFTVQTGFASSSYTELAFQAVSQGLLAGIAAIAIYTYIVQKIGPQRASLLMPSVPIITTLGGFAILGEALTNIQLFGLALLATGMAAPGLTDLWTSARPHARRTFTKSQNR